MAQNCQVARLLIFKYWSELFEMFEMGAGLDFHLY